MYATLEALCSARDSAMLEAMKLEDALIIAGTRPSVQDILYQRDAKLEEYNALQRQFETWNDPIVAPKESLLKKLFKK